ncbi:hypothetical protein [Lusitaniella coriacea]|uniref:hypothetical protein n=1 Tax=Lusitaniella coriacea TaxID=1983105 RepID=UPI003CF41874
MLSNPQQPGSLSSYIWEIWWKDLKSAIAHKSYAKNRIKSNNRELAIHARLP